MLFRSVADFRAPTPSAAAELIVPDRNELLIKIKNLKQRLEQSCGRLAAERRSYLKDLQARVKDPLRLTQDFSLRLDDLRERLTNTSRRTWSAAQTAMEQKVLRLARQNPAGIIREKLLLLDSAQKNLVGSFTHALALRRERLHRDVAILNTLSPLNVLQRGYSIASNAKTGEVIRRSDTLSPGQQVKVKLAAGGFNGTIDEIWGE